MGPRDVPYIHEGTQIDEVVGMMVRFLHTRLVYVVDEEKRLVGTITMGSLLRHIFPHHYEGKVHPHGILTRITAETARHIMDKKSIGARLDETVDEVLERMARTGVKEMAVLDSEGHILADITATDLLRHYHLEKDKRHHSGT